MKILITGATSGFGKAMSEKFAATGHDLIITGRRADRLKTLAEDLKQQFGIQVVAKIFDVQHKDEVFKALSNDSFLEDVDVVINNAGLALGRDLFDEASLDDWETMIDTNVKGLLYVTKAILPYFTKRGRGHIVNIGSTAGMEVYERGNVYCATKHAVEALSKSMRIDLVKHHIKVTAIHPGAADTEFSLVRFKGDETKAKAVYQGFKPLYANDVNCRWTELRQSTLSDAALFQFIDSMANLLEIPAQRHYQKWPILGNYVWPNNFIGQTYQEEITYLKNWIGERTAWMDANMFGTCTANDLELERTNLTIYPNPTTSMLHISGLTGNGQLEIIDPFGKHILSMPYCTESIELDLRNLSNGIYLISEPNKGLHEKIFKN